VATLDGLDRVVRVTDARNGTVVTRWDGVNRREETDKRGNTTTFDYDVLNRPVRVTDPAPFSAQTVETTYLDAQNRVSVKDRRGAVTVSQMDPLGRTLTVTRAGITQETNAYDQVGNKTSAKDGEAKETRFTYDAVNRLSRADGRVRFAGCGGHDLQVRRERESDGGARRAVGLVGCAVVLAEHVRRAEPARNDDGWRNGRDAVRV
jgi:YD repeat-containing protein